MDRVCLGVLTPSRIGLYVSKPGFNVFSAADLNLLFSSDINSFQMVQTGTVAVPRQAEGNGAVIGYPNLGYVPTILIMPNLGSRSDPPAGNYLVMNTWCSEMTVTSSRLHIEVSNYGALYTGTCTYGVLRKPYNG